MPVRIRIYGKEAVFSQGCWSCDDDALQAMLQSLVDPRFPFTDEAEREHGMYAAGRFGGLILMETGWVVADHPAPEITMEDLTGRRPKEREREKGGWFSWLKRRP